MASLTQIRSALKATVANELPHVQVYDTVPDNPITPAVVIMPQTASFDGAFQRGLDTWEFELYVLVSRSDASSSQDDLDAYITGDGPLSVRRILYEHADIGLTDGTDATLSGMRGYGGTFEAATLNYTGAVMVVTVRTPGRL